MAENVTGIADAHPTEEELEQLVQFISQYGYSDAKKENFILCENPTTKKRYYTVIDTEDRSFNVHLVDPNSTKISEINGVATFLNHYPKGFNAVAKTYSVSQDDLQKAYQALNLDFFLTAKTPPEYSFCNESRFDETCQVNLQSVRENFFSSGFYYFPLNTSFLDHFCSKAFRLPQGFEAFLKGQEEINGIFDYTIADTDQKAYTKETQHQYKIREVRTVKDWQNIINFNIFRTKIIQSEIYYDCPELHPNIVLRKCFMYKHNNKWYSIKEVVKTEENIIALPHQSDDTVLSHLVDTILYKNSKSLERRRDNGCLMVTQYSNENFGTKLSETLDALNDTEKTLLLPATLTVLKEKADKQGNNPYFNQAPLYNQTDYLFDKIGARDFFAALKDTYTRLMQDQLLPLPSSKIS